MNHYTCNDSRRDEFKFDKARCLLICYLFVAILLLVGLRTPLNAQNLCDVPARNYPCVDQPKEKDGNITGYFVAPGGTQPTQAQLTVSGFTPIPLFSIDSSGKFKFVLPGSLGPANVIQVTVNPSGATTGPVPVHAAQPAGRICSTPLKPTEPPCLKQPVEGDTELEGTLTPDGKAITVMVDDQPQKLTVTLNDSTFKVSALSRLNKYNTVEVIQSMPPPQAGSKPLSTGKVAVKPNNKFFNLGLNIPATSASLDFGHQAMQTESAGKQVTITNTTNNSVDLVDPSTTLTSNNFRVSANSCPSTLQPKAACSFQVVFAPFSPARVPGHADTDFIVIVPKGDQNAMDKFNSLTKQLLAHRSDADIANQQLQVLDTSTNPAVISQAMTSLNSLGSVRTMRERTAPKPASQKGPDEKDNQNKTAGQMDSDENNEQDKAITSSTITVDTTQLDRYRDQHSLKADATQSDKDAAHLISKKEAVDNKSYYLEAANEAINASQVTENDAIQELEKYFQVIALSGSPDHWKYPLTRAVVGIALSAPSSQAIKQAYFVDFDLLAPLTLPGMRKYKNQDPLENRLWLWFNPRITSLPQGANFSALSTINETGSFFSQESSKGTLGDIQGLDVNGGVEYAIVKPRDGIPWWAEYANTEARIAPSLIVGGGMSTPFSTSNTDVVSQVNQSICDAFSLIFPPQNPPSNPPPYSSSHGLVCGPGTSTSPVILLQPTAAAPNTPNSRAFIDFYTPQRSRFFRKAYAGLRLKTYFFSRAVKADCSPAVKRVEGDCDGLYDIFPGTIDLTFGKDEAVSHGKFSTWLFRLDAVYPLPFYQGIHLFASMYTGLQGNSPTQPYNAYTINTPTTGSYNDSTTFRYGIHPLDRDFFQIGIGLDLIQVFKKAANGGQPSSSAPAPKPAPATTTSPSP